MVYDRLDAEPRNARQVWKMVNCWSCVTIKIALDKLASQGLAIREAKPRKDGGITHFFTKSPNRPDTAPE